MVGDEEEQRWGPGRHKLVEVREITMTHISKESSTYPKGQKHEQILIIQMECNRGLTMGTQDKGENIRKTL